MDARRSEVPVSTRIAWRQRERPVDASGHMLKRYCTLLAPVLAAYFLFDRAAAYLHVPGTPLYLGESLLAFGLLACASATGYVRFALHNEPLLTILLGFIAWGLIRAVPNVRAFGFINVLHDSALWYYSLFAIVAVVATLASPNFPYRLTLQFSRFIPWMLVWLPIAVILTKSSHINFDIPGTQTLLLSHKDGNIAVMACIALAALWLIPYEGRSPRSRLLLSLLAISTILLAGTQNRGGLVAATVASAVGLLMNPRLIRSAALGIATIAIVIFAFSPLLPKTSTGAGSTRSISATQLIANLESVIGVGKAPNTQGTQQGRERQWSYVLKLEVNDGRLLYGFGSGPNLGFGQATGTGDETLRVPHNSHVDVAARLGLIGFCLWILLWSTWFWRLVGARERLSRAGLHRRRGIVEVCIIAAVAILTNAFFDPSLEGAQVGALLWTIFGIGLVLTNPRWASRMMGAPVAESSSAKPEGL